MQPNCVSSAYLCKLLLLLGTGNGGEGVGELAHLAHELIRGALHVVTQTLVGFKITLGQRLINEIDYQVRNTKLF